MTPTSSSLFLPRLLSPPWRGLRVVDGSLAFCDVSGFTALTERLSRKGKEGAEQITEILNATFGEMIRTAHRAGGDLLRFGGDALLLLFQGDGHADRAWSAMESMRVALGRRQVGGTRFELDMSAGIASGPVRLAVVGEDRCELFVIGRVASEAIRLEGEAVAGETRMETVTEAGGAGSSEGEEADVGGFLPFDLEAVRPRPEHRPLTVAFAKLSGTDDAFESDPVGAGRQLQEVMVVCAREAERHGVTLLSTDVTADGAKLIFASGVPATRGNNEERMLRMAQAVLDSHPPFGLRFGVATGHAFCGQVGITGRRVYTVMGDTVNLAARLVEKASPGEALTTVRTLSRSATAFTTFELAPMSLKGKSREIRPLRLGSVATEHRLRTDPPLTGRDEDLRQIVETLEGVGDGRGAVVTVEGPGGIGKSRLVREALHRVNLRHQEIPSDEFSQEAPYSSIRSLLIRMVGKEGGDDGREPLRDAIERHAPHLAGSEPLIGEVAGIDLPDNRVTSRIAPQFRGARAAEATAELLARLLDPPMLLVVGDAHWMDAGSAQVMDALAGLEMVGNGIGILVGRRSAEGGWRPRHGRTVALGPLGRESSLRLVRELTSETPLLPVTEEAIVDRAEGNPLFLLQLSEVAATGAELPDTLESIVSASIDRLDSAERDALRRLSVLGRSFTADDARTLLEGDGARMLDRLGQHLERTETGFRFRSPLIQEAAYEGLTFRRRRHLHRRIAEHLARSDEIDAATLHALSLHFSKAGMHPEAWRFGAAAAEAAADRHAVTEAAALFDRALSSASHIRPFPRGDVAEANEKLGDVLDRAGRPEEADAAYEKAQRGLDSATGQARVMRKRGLMRERMGNYGAAIRWLTRARRLVEPVEGADIELAEIEVAIAGVRFRQSRYRDAVEWTDQAIGRRRSIEGSAALGHAYYLRGHSRSFIEPETGRDDSDLALRIFDDLGDAFMQANVLNNLGVEAYNSGRWDEALDLQMRNARARDAAGDVVGGAVARYNAGLVLLDQGRTTEAEQIFSDTLRISRAANFPVAVAGSLGTLGTIAALRGDEDEAMRLHRDSLERFESMGADYFVFITKLRIAESALLRDEPEVALTEAEESLSLAAARDGAESARAGLTRVRGIALRRMGREEEAISVLRRALEMAPAEDEPYERLLTLDVLIALGFDDLVTEHDELWSRLGIARLPDFLSSMEAAGLSTS